MNFFSAALIVLLSIIIINLLNKKHCEGFNSGSKDYKSCIEKGFTKEFCLQTPSAAFFPGTCKCENGSIGHYIPGFKGECMCGYYNN